MYFEVLEGLDYYYLAGSLSEEPLIIKFTGDSEPLLGRLKRVLSRHPFRNEPIRLNSWHANVLSANQD